MDYSDTIAIIGTSNLGNKIGQLFSKAGSVVIRGKTGFTQDMSEAAFIIEAIDSGLEPKKQVLAECAKKALPQTILATTTSGVVTEIGTLTGRPKIVLGANFIFNPFAEKCLVQLARGLETSAEAIATVKSAVEKTGATVIVVADVPGLLVDRTLAIAINEAAIIATTNTASKEDIDKITKLCLNWPMGPFEFADYLGIDYVVAILEEAAKETPKYLPCRLLREMVSAGRLGRRTGKGFYNYD